MPRGAEGHGRTTHRVVSSSWSPTDLQQPFMSCAYGLATPAARLLDKATATSLPLPCRLLISDSHLTNLPALRYSGTPVLRPIAPTPRAPAQQTSTPRQLPAPCLYHCAPRDCVQDPCPRTPPPFPNHCPGTDCVDAGDCLDLSRDNAGTVADVACSYANVQCQPQVFVDGVAQAVAQGVSGVEGVSGAGQNGFACCKLQYGCVRFYCGRRHGQWGAGV